MINYIEFLNVPAKIAIVLVGLFLVIQVIGELLEFKGKVVPEFAKIRKVFARRKKERMLLQKMEKTIDQVQLTLDDLNQHYSTDNIRMRDEWMRLVNSKLEQYDKSISELGVKLDKNNSDTLSILIDSKRNAIISFASLVIDESKPVEMLAGIEYVADCWALRLVGQRTLDSEDRYDTTFFIQLELTGLGSVGSDPIEDLRRAIPGYRPTTDQPGPAGLYDYYE